MNYSNHFSPFSLTCQGRKVCFQRPAVMGIVNATADSFYDGGRHKCPRDFVNHARQLLADGADIIDLGAASSRPGASLISPDNEEAVLLPLVRLLRSELPAGTPISVDTYNSRPAAHAIEAGADIINDISGGQFDTQMLPTAASLHVPYILTHTKGIPADMLSPENLRHSHLLDEMKDYSGQRLDELCRLGASEVIIDPGFGFAKTVEQNYELLHSLADLADTFPDAPLLAALSNKSMITRRLASDPLPDTGLPLPDSEFGTLALNVIAMQSGARLLRVHTPRPTRIAIKTIYNS